MNRLINEFARLLAPQQNRCHLCGNRLYTERCCLCEDCIRLLSYCTIPPHDKAVNVDPISDVLSAYGYMNEAKKLVQLLKFQHDFSAAEPLAIGMMQAFQLNEWESFIDLIVPVPLHKRRLAERGYNQSTLLSNPLADYFHLPLSESALVRTRYTGTQLQRSGKERRTALIDAFLADHAQVRDKRVLLVDDVFTTGSTGICCAQALLEGGARSVWMITACRA